MANESITDKRKRIFTEICKKIPNIIVERPYSVSIHNPNAVTNEGDVVVTQNSLQAAIRMLLELLENNPEHTGEISMYERRKRQLIYKMSSK